MAGIFWICWNRLQALFVRYVSQKRVGRHKVPPLLPVKALSNYLLLFGL